MDREIHAVLAEWRRVEDDLATARGARRQMLARRRDELRDECAALFDARAHAHDAIERGDIQGTEDLSPEELRRRIIADLAAQDVTPDSDQA